MSVSKNYQTGLLVLRVGISSLMLFHGIPKLIRLFEGDMSFPDPLGIGAGFSFILVVIAEAICPILIILGLKARLAAIPPIIAMAVAAFLVHWKDGVEGMELALMYLIGFVAIALMGAGKYTIKQLF